MTEYGRCWHRYSSNNAHSVHTWHRPKENLFQITDFGQGNTWSRCPEYFVISCYRCVRTKLITRYMRPGIVQYHDSGINRATNLATGGGVDDCGGVSGVVSGEGAVAALSMRVLRRRRRRRWRQPERKIQYRRNAEIDRFGFATTAAAVHSLTNIYYNIAGTTDDRAPSNDENGKINKTKKNVTYRAAHNRTRDDSNNYCNTTKKIWSVGIVNIIPVAFSARDKIDLSNIDFKIRTCVRGDAAVSRNRRTRIRTRPLDVAAIVCPWSDGKRVFDGFSRKSSFPRIVRVRVFRRVRTQTVAATLTVFTWYRDGSRVSPGTLPGFNIWHDEHDFMQAYDTYQRVRWKYGRTQQQQQKLAGRNPDGDRRVATRRIQSASPRTETHGALDFEYLFIRSGFVGSRKSHWRGSFSRLFQIISPSSLFNFIRLIYILHKIPSLILQ